MQRRAFHIAEAVRGNHSNDLNQHFAPQLLMLQAAASAGLRLDWVGTHLRQWHDMKIDMVAKGYKSPGVLPYVRGRSYSKLTKNVFAAMSPEGRAAACSFIIPEYEAFGLPIGPDNVCAPSPDPPPSERNGTDGGPARRADRKRSMASSGTRAGPAAAADAIKGPGS